ncbi:radical SAM/SPASM domain-containing protein [bacterium]
MIKKIYRLLTVYLPNLLQVNLLWFIPFLKPLIKIKPDFISLNITERCCLKCIMCNEWQNSKPDLTCVQWQNVLQESKDIGINSVYLSGGEPFIRKDIFDLIDYANSLNMDVSCITNGYLIDQEKIERLKNSKITTIALSIDAIDEKYDYIRGLKGAYHRVINACNLLKKLSQETDTKVYINFVLMKDTLEDFKDVKALCEEYEFPIVICLLDYSPEFFKVSENKNDFWIRSEEDFARLTEIQSMLYDMKKKNHHSVLGTYSDIDYIYRYFKDPIQHKIPCAVSQTRVVIDSGGNVYGGCWSLGTHGNITEHSLNNILASDKYIKSHNKMFYKKCPGCSCGYMYNTRYFLPEILKNIKISYSKR